MKRGHVIALLRVAGYHGDSAAYIRLRVEQRISSAAAAEAFREGERARASGVPCACFECAGGA